MSEIDLYELNVQKAILTHLMTDEEVKIQEERNRRTGTGHVGSTNWLVTALYR